MHPKPFLFSPPKPPPTTPRAVSHRVTSPRDDYQCTRSRASRLLVLHYDSVKPKISQNGPNTPEIRPFPAMPPAHCTGYGLFGAQTVRAMCAH
eukprot:814487-Prymnesium_polylepis.1